MRHTLTFHSIKLGKQIQKALKSQNLPFSLGTTPASAILLISQYANISQSQIARHLHLEPASIVSMIDELEKLKLVKRIASKKDRRRYQLTLTDAGINAAKIINKQTDKLDNFLRNKLSLKELNILLEITGKLTDYLDEWNKVNGHSTKQILAKGGVINGNTRTNQPVALGTSHKVSETKL